ncbi:MAG: class I SAM-dependent methyltransferase [Coriobacteriia bacterium]|nr:class I SAM-dependent methyltransferase [Coriobacteriia bacterium]
MSYIQSNKAAWEEAFERRKHGWGDNNHVLLKQEELYFFNLDMKELLQSMDFAGKTIAQFCCNNGRELLSLVQYGASHGVGFDIAENIIEQARETAEKAGILNCNFEICSVLDIPAKYYRQFDFIFFTIGGIAWIDDLGTLFRQVSLCMKPGAVLLINDQHPFLSMLPVPGEEEFEPETLNRIAFSYFRHEPWVSTDGMQYMSGDYISKPFTSFTHTFSKIINAIVENDMQIISLSEYDYDVGITDVYDGLGIPLSYILQAKKS